MGVTGQLKASVILKILGFVSILEAVGCFVITCIDTPIDILPLDPLLILGATSLFCGVVLLGVSMCLNPGCKLEIWSVQTELANDFGGGINEINSEDDTLNKVINEELCEDKKSK